MAAGRLPIHDGATSFGSVEGYLTSIGVRPEELMRLRHLLLEQA